MCKLKSAIILKNRVFISDHDSHSKMLEELGITDDYINASKVFVRAELSPADGDAFSDIDGWEFSVDQDITPEWFDEKDCAERMRKAVKEWAKTHIFIGQNELKISHGENIFIKDCKNVDIRGNATVKHICGKATVKYIYDNATVKYIYDNATVERICGDATVESIYDNATVENICGNATVENICDNATVKNIYGNATVENIGDNATVENICDNATVENICGNATVENICDNATVKHICGKATVKYIYDNATVKYICGNATVENIGDNATVEYICGKATVKYIYGNATVISSRYTKWNNSASLIISDNATFKDCYSKMIYQAGGWEFVKVTGGK